MAQNKKSLLQIRMTPRTLLLILIFVFLLTALITQGVLYWAAEKQGMYSSRKTPVKVNGTAGSGIRIIPQSSPSAAPIPVKKNSYFVPQVSGNSLKVPILMYHYIGNNPNPNDHARDTLSVVPDEFDKQLQYLSSSGYIPISLDTFYAALKKQVTLPSKPIILTFDDGYIDFYVNAFPLLKKYHFHATEFIPTGLMNQGYYLTWDEIKQMQSSGLISFEAHSVHHYDLASLSDSALNFELSQSKQTLQSELGVPVNFMAYPYGISDTRVQQAAQRAGYLGAAGTWRGEIQSEGTIYNMPRVRITGHMDLQSFIQAL